MKPLHLRIYRSSADTSGDEYVSLPGKLPGRHLSEIRRYTERSHDVSKGITLIHGTYFCCRCTYLLRHDCDSSGILVVITYSKRNALTVFCCTHYEELSRKGSCRQSGSLYLHPADRRRQHFFSDDSIHFLVSKFVTLSPQRYNIIPYAVRISPLIFFFRPIMGMVQYA